MWTHKTVLLRHLLWFIWKECHCRLRSPSCVVNWALPFPVCWRTCALLPIPCCPFLQCCSCSRACQRSILNPKAGGSLHWRLTTCVPQSAKPTPSEGQTNLLPPLDLSPPEGEMLMSRWCCFFTKPISSYSVLCDIDVWWHFQLSSV